MGTISAAGSSAVHAAISGRRSGLATRSILLSATTVGCLATAEAIGEASSSRSREGIRPERSEASIISSTTSQSAAAATASSRM